MDFETGRKSIFPTYDELMDFSLISTDVENRNFENVQDGVLTTKDLMDVLAAIGSNMNSVADMNTSIADDTMADEIQDDDIIMNQRENTASSSDATQSSSADDDEIAVIENDTVQPDNTPASVVSNPNNHAEIINAPKITNKNYNKILFFTDKIEETFKYGSMQTQPSAEELQILKKIKSDMMAKFVNYDELIAFLYTFVIERQNSILESIYLLFNLIFILPHPLRYLYLIDYQVFNSMNGYGYHIRLFKETLEGLSSRHPPKYNCPDNLNEITDEIEKMLTSCSSKKIIHDDIIDIVKQIKGKMNKFDDHLDFIKFLFDENKTFRLYPTGYLLLNMIYVLPHPEKYMYLLRFPLRPNALLRLLNDMNGY